jgi:hypothetical protein
MALHPSLQRLMDDAKTRVPGALESAIKAELFTVMTEFFSDSNVWQEEIPFDTAVDTTDYPISPAAEGRIERVLYVKNADDRPVRASYPNMEFVRLAWTPTKIETLTAVVALTSVDPTDRDGYPQVPHWIYDKYGTGLLDGVLGRMMSQPAKPYSSTQLALMHMGRFRNTISRARRESIHQNLYGAQSWSYPQSFATSRR